MSDSSVKKLIKTAKARGYVTYDELNEVMPSEEVSSEQIEDVMSMLSDMGINVVDEDEVEEAEAATPAVAEGAKTVTKTTTKAEPTDRTDDPVRMYLREMGTVDLLSREGEIAIAKRIEAGREAMIAGLCESPLTFQAIIIWHDELTEGKILLRDIIDLEATYAGPEAKDPAIMGQTDSDDEGDSEGEKSAEPALLAKNRPPQPPPIRTPPSKPTKPAKTVKAPQTMMTRMRMMTISKSMSLAAMEAELKRRSSLKSSTRYKGLTKRCKSRPSGAP